MKHTLFVCSLIALVLLGAIALADTPQWIQSEERLVGENSTSYEDTLNRPVKTVWNTFLVEHGTDGFHDYSSLAEGLIPYKHTWDFVEIGDYDGHSHTLISLGAASQADVDALETSMSTAQSDISSLETSMSTAQSDISSLETSMSTAQSDISSLETLFLNEHNTDGTHAIATGGGVTYWGLQSTSHATTLLSASQDTLTAFESDELQISVLAEVDDLNTAEVFLEIETTYNAYTCPKIRFGKDAANHLYVEHCTNVTSSTSQVYTSASTITAQQQGRMVEYAVKVDEGAGITFYMDGLADTVSISSVMDKSGTGTDVLRLFKGFKGIGGSVKVGSKALWPDAWKGISRAGEAFPFAVFAIPLSEGEGASVTDAIGGLSLSTSGAWIEIPGPY